MRIGLAVLIMFICIITMIASTIAQSHIVQRAEQPVISHCILQSPQYHTVVVVECGDVRRHVDSKSQNKLI